MRKLIGPHLGGQWANNFEILRRWQPTLILVLQPEVDKVQQLRDAIPGATIIGRFFHDDSHYSDGINTRPKEFASEIHNEIVSNPVTPLLDYVQSNNEVCQDWEGIQKLNEYTQEWMHLADQSQAYKCAILAFSVGNPDLPHKPGDPAGFDGKMLYWQQVLPSLNYAQANDHILLMHAYGYPNMFAPDANWYIYRYERQVQANLRTLGITKLRYAYGEIGIDGLIVNKKEGYKAVTSDQDYVNQQLQWERDLQGEDLLLGGAIFTFGDSGGWGSYDITSTNAASMIATHYADHAGDYDGSGGSSDEGETIFIPTVGTGEPPVSPQPQPQRNEDPRAKARGVNIETPSVAPGQPYWFIYEIKYYNEQEADQLGPDHHFMIDVRDENNQRVVGKDVMVAWSTAEAPQKTEPKTGEEYATGFGMSPGKNAYSGWVSDGLPSEKITGVGMGEETPGGWNAGIHTTTGAKWRKEIMAAQTTPPEPAPTPVPVPTPTPVAVPVLTHPIQDPAKRVVSQNFGDNPQDYERFGLAGHNGIDFGVPTGTPIVAVDDGQVVEVLDDPTGYGKYIKLRHVWGESLYAHLSVQNLLGGHVSRGGIIGRSGNTGNSTGPHLHFAMRVYPYKRGKPFNGFSDPAPYLAATSVPSPATGNIRQISDKAAADFGVDPDVLINLLYAEDRFRMDGPPSPKGAIGPAQITEPTWREWSPRVGATDIRNPVDNIRVGARYLKWCLDQFDGDLIQGLYAYNWGYGNVMSDDAVPIETKIYAYSIVHGAGIAKALRKP